MANCKTLVAIWVLLFISKIAFCQNRHDQNSYSAYSLVVQLNDYKKDKLVLEFRYPDYSSRFDTIHIENGYYRHQGSVKEPTLAHLWYDRYKAPIPLFLEKGAIEVMGSVNAPYDMEVKGSELSKQYLSLLRGKTELSRQRSKLYLYYKEAKDSGDSTKASEILRRGDSLQNERAVLARNFIKKNPSSFVSIYELRSWIDDWEYAELTELYRHLDPALHRTEIGQYVASRLEIKQRTSIGQPATAFTQPDTEGNKISLSDFKGKYVLLDFWGSSCAPCRLENKNLVKMYEKYGGVKFEIVSVSYDNNEKAWKSAIAKDGLTWTNLCDLSGDKNEPIVLYGVTSFPTNYLIDPNGVIIAKNLRGEELQSTLAKLFEK